jgi:hypothetical protein
LGGWPLEHLGGGEIDFSSFQDMSFYNFMEIYHPEVDIGSLTSATSTSDR